MDYKWIITWIITWVINGLYMINGLYDIWIINPIGSMVLLYMVTWIPSIYSLYVSIYTSTMEHMGMDIKWIITWIITWIIKWIIMDEYYGLVSQ